MTGKSSDELLNDISNKLDALIRLSALNLVNNIELQRDKISILDEAGFAPKQIADIVGTSGASVSQTLYAIRKERAAKEGKESSKETKSEPMTGEEKKEESAHNAEEKTDVEKSTNSH